MTPYVSLILISGDSGAKTIAKAIDSFTARRLVDEVVIGWNGKTGRALIPSESHGVPVHVHPQEWRKDFAYARNEAHRHARGVWHLRLDSDDVLLPHTDPEVVRKAALVGLDARRGFAISDPAQFRSELKQLEAQGTNIVTAPYYYSVAPDGRPIIEHVIRRIVRWRDSEGNPVWEWHRRIHEDLRPILNVPLERQTYNPTILVVQHQDHAEPRTERNKEIHDEYVRELTSTSATGTTAADSTNDSTNDSTTYRDWYNAGAMSFDAGDWATARVEFEKALAPSQSDLSFSLATREMLFWTCIYLNDLLTATAHAMSMVEMDPSSRHGFWATALIHHARGEWAKCIEWFQMGQSKGQSLPFAPENRMARIVKPALAAADAYSRLENHTAAIRIAEEARLEWPWDEEINATVAEISRRKEQAVLVAAVERVSNHFQKEVLIPRLETREKAEAWLVERSKGKCGKPCYPSVPNTRGLFPCAKPFGHSDGCEPSTPSSRKITILAPVFVERWQPEWIETTGTGGSEEAIVYFSAELARRGYDVEVYSPVDGVREFRGVRYIPVESFDASKKYDLLIAHRTIVPSSLARDVFVWHHDHLAPGYGDVSDPRLRHLFVSDWQRKNFGVAGRGLVIGNGVPEEECPALSPDNFRNPHRAVYASQPTRGLYNLLSVWPLIRQQVPDAELRVFYGFKTVEELAKTQPETRAEIERLKPLCENPPAGVVIRGRVSQKRLMEEFREAGVWVYHCTYPEVSCITGMRAAAAGCVPVYTDVGALSETQALPPATKFVNAVAQAMVWFDRVSGGATRADLRKIILDRSSWGKVVDRFLAGAT